jgi:hypothetical protein
MGGIGILEHDLNIMPNIRDLDTANRNPEPEILAMFDDCLSTWKAKW